MIDKVMCAKIESENFEICPYQPIENIVSLLSYFVKEIEGPLDADEVLGPIEDVVEAETDRATEAASRRQKQINKFSRAFVGKVSVCSSQPRKYLLTDLTDEITDGKASPLEIPTKKSIEERKQKTDIAAQKRGNKKRRNLPGT